MIPQLVKIEIDRILNRNEGYYLNHEEFEFRTSSSAKSAFKALDKLVAGKWRRQGTTILLKGTE